MERQTDTAARRQVTNKLRGSSTRRHGSEFINHDAAAWLWARDIARIRSRPSNKNDQATVESKNNHVVRKHPVRWRYDTADELTLLNQLRPLVSMGVEILHADEETHRVRQGLPRLWSTWDR